MQMNFEDFWKQHGWNVILVACFLIGQFYLIEYRMTLVESAVDQNSAETTQLIKENTLSIQANSSRIHQIEVTRASDMAELRALLGGLKEQFSRIENLTEAQFNSIQALIKNQEKH